MALTRGFDSLTHLLTGSATVAAIVISQSVAVSAKTGDEVYKIAVPVTVQINSDSGNGQFTLVKSEINSAIPINTFIALKPQIRQVNTTVTVNNTANSRVANLNNPSTAADYVNRGVVRYDSKDYQGAISDFNKAIKINPNYAMAYNNRGNARSNLKDYQGAISDYDKALKIDPNFAMAYNNRGLARNNLKDYQGAISDYDKAIKIDPNYADGYVNRGSARSKLKDYQGAISDYDKALKIDSNDAITYAGRGNARYDLKDYQGA
ncbi:MAG TPA: pilus assembly protein PilF, partial [Oscillatoriales bacterium UBA8482]|nr:pilus assembly protein PilF [Oscillatoriales bacterium UBA8482]